MLDGVYRTTEGVPVFHAVCAPTPAELQAPRTRIIKRVMRLLTGKDYLIEEHGMTTLADTDPEAALGPLQAAACTYRIAFEASLPGLAGNVPVAPTPAAFGTRAGQKVLSLQTVPSPIGTVHPTTLCQRAGLSLHAGVRLGINQRAQLHAQGAWAAGRAFGSLFAGVRIGAQVLSHIRAARWLNA